MADECDFLELLIASERVEAWIDTIKDTNNTSRYSSYVYVGQLGS